MKNKNYIDAQQFSDFKTNQDKLIDILNHNVTDMKKDIKSQTKSLSSLVNIVSEMKGSFKVTQKVIWGIAGFIGTLVTVIIVGVIQSV